MKRLQRLADAWFKGRAYEQRLQGLFVAVESSPNFVVTFNRKFLLKLSTLTPQINQSRDDNRSASITIIVN